MKEIDKKFILYEPNPIAWILKQQKITVKNLNAYNNLLNNFNTPCGWSKIHTDTNFSHPFLPSEVLEKEIQKYTSESYNFEPNIYSNPNLPYSFVERILNYDYYMCSKHCNDLYYSFINPNTPWETIKSSIYHMNWCEYRAYTIHFLSLEKVPFSFIE